MTASMGVAVGRDTVDPDALLDAADRVLYQAKDAGRNRLYTVEVATGAANAPPRVRISEREREPARG